MTQTQMQKSSNGAQYLRLAQLKVRLSVSGSSIWAWVKDETFPQPVKLSTNVTAWDIDDIKNWEAQRKSAKKA